MIKVRTDRRNMQPLLGALRPIESSRNYDVRRRSLAQRKLRQRPELATRRPPLILPHHDISLALPVEEHENIEHLKSKRGWTMPPESLVLKKADTNRLQKQRAEIRRRAITKSLGRDESQPVPGSTAETQKLTNQKLPRKRLHQSRSPPPLPTGTHTEKVKKYAPPPRCAELPDVDWITRKRERHQRLTDARWRREQHLNDIKIKSVKMMTRNVELKMSIKPDTTEEEECEICQDIKEKLKEDRRVLRAERLRKRTMAMISMRRALSNTTIKSNNESPRPTTCPRPKPDEPGSGNRLTIPSLSFQASPRVSRQSTSKLQCKQGSCSRQVSYVRSDASSCRWASSSDSFDDSSTGNSSVSFRF